MGRLLAQGGSFGRRRRAPFLVCCGLAVLAAGLAGCAPKDSPCTGADCAGPTDSGAGSDTALPEESCVEDDAAFLSLEDEETRVDTVHRVRWSLATPAPAFVRFEDGGQPMRTPEVPAADSQEILLLGTGALQTVSWQVWVPDGAGGFVCSAPHSYQTGALDPEIPELGVQLTGGADQRGALALVAIISQDWSMVTALDRAGRVVWWLPASHMTTRVRLARGGGAVLFAAGATSIAESAIIERVGLDGVPGAPSEITGGHTDFTELPDGSLAMLGWDIRPFEGGKRHLLGDTIVERSPDGSQRVVWDIYDDLVPDLTRSWFSSFYQADPTVEDWSHANGIGYDPVDDQYLVSISSLSLVVAIDRSSGRLAWSVGGADATLDTPDGLIDNPHSVQRQPDGSYLVFNRRKKTCSSVEHFTVDREAGRAELLETYASPDCLRVDLLGDARGLPDDGLLISWSSSGRIQELDAARNTTRQVDLSLGAIFGFIDPVSSLYDVP